MVHITFTPRACLSALVLGTIAVASASGQAPPHTARVRSTNATLLKLIDEGVERSATFERLVKELEESRGIVYVEAGSCAFGHLNGCLLPYIVSSHGDRYLRVVVTTDKTKASHDQLLALIAHELRHALEVIEHDEVVNLPTMEAMYARIGVPMAGLSGHETSAARAAGASVLDELTAPRSTP